jgi:hypothetical protein
MFLLGPLGFFLAALAVTGMASALTVHAARCTGSGLYFGRVT